MDEILVDREGGVVTVTLNRPRQRNAVTRPMWRQLADIFDEIAKRPDDVVLLLTGAGEAFCSGADLGSTDDSHTSPIDVMRDVAKAATALHTMKKPTIAKVDGAAVGAGLGMALACDMVVASDRSRFCASFSKRAMSVDFATSWLLPRLVGLQAAKELVFFADMLSADQALRRGLINRVTTPQDLDATASEWVQRLCALPQLALSLSKEMLNRSFEMSIDQALQAESYAQVVNLSGTEVIEARTAFMEKRAPVFGRR